MSNYLSVVEVSKLLVMSEKWVYKHQHELPGRFRIGKAIFFDRELLEAGLKEMVARPTPKPRADDGNDPHGLRR